MMRATCIACLLLAILTSSIAKATSYLIVGGGPSPKHNEVAIESNVRYLLALLGPSSIRVLFGNGEPDGSYVVFRDTAKNQLYFRAARLPQLDGPATLSGLDALWQDFAANADDLLVLYFTGHGRPTDGALDSRFLLWGGGELHVDALAQRLAQLPDDLPVVLVMAQCFSGAFANVLFKDGAPSKGLVDRDVAGFFAATADRPAAGCTPEIDEATYDDFTSYFFAALSGMERTGTKAPNVDYNHDGEVGMDEALAYARAASNSIDVPVATSEIFARRYAPVSATQVEGANLDEVLARASVPQRVALAALAQQLGATGPRAIAKVAKEHRLRHGNEARQAKQLRFLLLVETVLAEARLQQAGDSALVDRFLRLQELESINPLPATTH